MATLSTALRSTLEKAVVEARKVAEAGAGEALKGLAVDAAEPFSSMTEAQRKLRNRLRAHGRQLGDALDRSKGTQAIGRLIREVAYAHWHRMLFARFLADNHLLIEPTSGVSISMEECEELAKDEGVDPWGLAARYAQGMLPEIFRTDDPVLELAFAPEIRQKLQKLVSDLQPDVFTASDSLGWTYQFWQTAAKKAVNDSGVKIGADELSAVTQLFTEVYMVDFLLDNTLGAWHAGKVLASHPTLAATAQSEADLRQAVALPGCPWSCLRFIKTDHGPWAPASGTFMGWPTTAAELRCLDPCMGSGHFVVALFERLVALRKAEEGLDEKTAVAAVVDGNLFGLEIDPRCTQIAAFNLALAAWRRVGHCQLPAMNLACSGLAPNTTQADWLALAGENERLRNGMARLYGLFDKAAVLGSLINPRFGDSELLVASFHELQPLLELALVQETKDDNAHEMAVTARGLAKAAEILADQFTLVATNVPFLGGYKQCEVLADYLETAYRKAGGNLANAFLMRIGSFVGNGHTLALVTPQDWMLLGRYTKLREALLPVMAARALAFLGPHAFETIRGEVVTAGLSVWDNTAFSGSGHSNILAMDAQRLATPVEKGAALATECLVERQQSEWLANPNKRITVESVSSTEYLSAHTKPWQGVKTSDDDRFVCCFWELDRVRSEWRFYIRSLSDREFSGREHVLFWEDGTGQLRQLNASQSRDRKRDTQGAPAWGKLGIAINTAGRTISGVFLGETFASEVVVLTCKPPVLLAVLAFTRSPSFSEAIRKLDKRVSITTSTFSQVPFDLAHWQEVAAENYPHGLSKPFSGDPTQWLFNGHPAGADQPLHVAVARLVGYLWPRQTDSSFPDCQALGSDGLETLTDADGIVCLAAVRGEASAADRLRKLLAAAFQEEWTAAKERELLLATAVENKAKAAAPDLDSWLRDCFFMEHCKLFHSRPFIWQIWDGHPKGFSALVNYHKLAAPDGEGRRSLEALTYTYLGDWMDLQKEGQSNGVVGSDDRLAAAQDLQAQLVKILEGEPPYDIFVRWKPLQKQAIGWDPDINDGVRLNIRPFMNSSLRRGGRTGAGILRWKPSTIKWAKDRGKEPTRPVDQFPWFSGWEENNAAMAIDFGSGLPGSAPASAVFDGNRWNDLHYSRKAKEATRARQEGTSS